MAEPTNAQEPIAGDVFLPYLKLSKSGDEIISAIISDDSILTQREAQEIADAINVFTSRIQRSILIIPGKNNSIREEFLQQLATGNVLQYNALAFVLRDVEGRNVADTLLISFNPKKPVMFFEKEEDAVAWLKSRTTWPPPSSPDPNVELALSEEGIKITAEIHHPDFDLYKRSDGIIVRISKDYSWVTRKEVEESIIAMKEITGGIPHLVLAISGTKSSLDKDARDYATTEEAMRFTKATAVVIKSWPQRVIGNIILTVNNPAKPFRLFESSKEAIEWLKSQQ